MTEPSGYEMADVLAALVGVGTGCGPEPAEITVPISQRVEILADIDQALKMLAHMRDAHVARLHAQMVTAPRGGLELPTDRGAVKVRVAASVSRTKIRHAELFGALDLLADTPAHRVDPATGEDIGRAAARLKLRERCSSPSWKWAELEHLGLSPAAFCIESVDTKITIAGDGVKLSPMRVPQGSSDGHSRPVLGTSRRWLGDAAPVR